MPTAPDSLDHHLARLSRLLVWSALLNAPLALFCAALMAAFASDAPAGGPGLALAWGLGFLAMGLLVTVGLPLFARRVVRRPPHATGWVVAHALYTFFMGPWGPFIGLGLLRACAAVRKLRGPATPVSCD